jgi:hypothetical protein
MAGRPQPTFGLLSAAIYPSSRPDRANCTQSFTPLKDLGWPARRKRLMAAAINLESLAWVGPTTEDAVYRDFQNYFFKHTVADGDVWSNLDTPENIKAARLRAYTAGDKNVTLENILDVKLGDMFKSPTTGARINGYFEATRDMAGSSGTYVADIAWNPDGHFRGSPWLPTLTKSTFPVLMAKKLGENPLPDEGYIITDKELAISQGWPSLELPY